MHGAKKPENSGLATPGHVNAPSDSFDGSMHCIDRYRVGMMYMTVHATSSGFILDGMSWSAAEHTDC